MKYFLYLNIAGFNIKLIFHANHLTNEKEITHKSRLKKNIEKLFKAYTTTTQPKRLDLTIDLLSSIPITIEKKYKKGNRYFIFFFEEIGRKIITFQHISLHQFMILLRNSLQRLLTLNNGFFLHASAVNYRGKAILFCGPPNAGKSTIMSLLNEKFPGLVDDVIIIKKVNDIFFCYQTPFIEKNSWLIKQNKKYQISKIFFLRKSSLFQITKINKLEDKFSLLSKQLWSTNTTKRRQTNLLFNFSNQFKEVFFLNFIKDKNLLINYFNKVLRNGL